MVKKKRGNSSVRPERAESKEKPYKPRPSKHAQLQAAAARKPPAEDPAVKPDRRRKKVAEPVKVEAKPLPVAPATQRTFAHHAELMKARSEWVRQGRQSGVQSYGVYVTADPFDPFIAYIQEGGVRRIIGAFPTPYQAHDAYVEEKKRAS